MKRSVVRVVVVVAALWSIAALWLVVSAAAAVRGGTDEVRAVQRGATIDSLLEPEVVASLDEAGDRFASARSSLSSPVLWPARALPVVGRHLTATRDAAGAAAESTEVASGAVERLAEVSERSVASGSDRVAVLREVGAVAADAEEQLAAVDVGNPDGLASALSTRLVDLEDARGGAERSAGQLALVTDSLASILEGPDRYLLVGANNAEMRSGSGMFLSAAELSFDQGQMTLGDVRPTAELVRPAGSVPVDGDLAANWPWLDPGRDLRNLGLTADLPQSAAIAMDNWAGVPEANEVAGLIVVDVDAMRSLLRVIGPVEVDGTTYTADTVRGELLRTQYQGADDRQEERRDELGQVAKAIFDRIDAGDWKLAELATEIVDAVQGRHLLVWSADPEANAAWEAVGADGHLTETTVATGLLNRSAAKLDSWVDTDTTMTTTARDDGTTDVRLEYRIANGAPVEGSRYLVGPNVEGAAPGEYVGLAMVNLPLGTTDLEIEGAREFLRGADGPTVVIGGEVRVPAGSSATVVVTGRLPEGLDAVTIEPSARIPKATWTVDGEAIDRDRRRRVAVSE